MNFDALSNQALASGNQRQADLNQQSAQTQQQYGQQFASAQAAQNQLQDYTNSIQGGGQQAQDYLSQQYKQLGIDPQAIQSANQQIARTQTALQNSAQAAQQQGGGYGMTAGGAAQGLTNLQGNLNQTLNAQSNQATALSAQLDQALKNATMIESSQQTSQQQKLSGYQNAANVAQQLAATAGDTMTKIESLAQQQGYVTSETVNQYQDAKAKIITANAAAAASYAQAGYYTSQTTGQNLINDSMRNVLKVSQAQNDSIKFNPSTQTANFYTTSGQQINLGQWTKINNLYPIDVLRTAANQGDVNAQAALSFVGNDGKPDPSKLNNAFNVNGRNVSGSSIYNTLFGNSYLGGASATSNSNSSNYGYNPGTVKPVTFR